TENEIFGRLGLRPLDLGDYPACVDPDERKSTATTTSSSTSLTSLTSSLSVEKPVKKKKPISILQRDKQLKETLQLSPTYDLDMSMFPYWTKHHKKRKHNDTIAEIEALKKSKPLEEKKETQLQCVHCNKTFPYSQGVASKDDQPYCSRP